MNASAMPLETPALRKALSLYATGVTIVTATGMKGQKLGITANSFSSVSLDPPLILFSLDRRAFSLPDFLSTNHFAVNVLSDAQQDLSRRFAQSMTDKWDGIPFEIWDHDCPILKGCHAVFECSIAYTYSGGDHVIFVGKVERFSSDDTLIPLLYYGSRYRSLAAARSTEGSSDKPDAANKQTPKRRFGLWGREKT